MDITQLLSNHTGGSAVNLPSFDTGVMTPTADKLYLAAVEVDQASGGTASTATLSGGGLDSWTLLDNVAYSSNSRRLHLFGGVSDDTPGAGAALTIDCGGVNHRSARWQVYEIGGAVVTSLASGLAGTPVKDSAFTSTLNLEKLDAAADNMLIAFFASVNTGGPTTEDGWTNHGQANHTFGKLLTVSKEGNADKNTFLTIPSSNFIAGIMVEAVAATPNDVTVQASMKVRRRAPSGGGTSSPVFKVKINGTWVVVGRLGG